MISDDEILDDDVRVESEQSDMEVSGGECDDSLFNTKSNIICGKIGQNWLKFGPKLKVLA